MTSTKNLGLTAILFGLLAAQARAEEPELRLPLSDYEELQSKVEAVRKPKPGVAVVDVLRLSGSIAKHDLRIGLSGRAMGKADPFPVFRGEFQLRDCTGSALLAHSQDGFVLSPQKPEFTVQCRLSRNSNGEDLEFRTSGAVLWVESVVSDAEFASVDSEDGARSLVLSRRSAQPTWVAATVSQARYTLTLLPDGTRFTYAIAVHNPNQLNTAFMASFVSGEQVERSEGGVRVSLSDWQDQRGQKGTTAMAILPPGDRTLTFVGTLTGSTFEPPVDAGQQFLLLDTHPLLRVDVNTQARRISVPETGIAQAFRGARAFLLKDGDILSWRAEQTDTMSAPALAITRADHTFFVTREGHVIGESAVSLENQGDSELTIPMNSRPLFASQQGIPTLLTTRPNGDLWLSLAQGAQSLGLQFRSDLTTKLGLAWGDLWLPQFDSPTTDSHVELRLAKEWMPVYQRFEGQVRLHRPPDARLAWAVMIAIGGTLAIAALGLSWRRTLTLSALAFCASLSSDGAAWLLILGEVGVGGVWVFARLRHLGQSSLLAAALASSFGVALAVALQPTEQNDQAPAFARIAPPPPPSMPTAGGLAAVSASAELCDGIDDDCLGIVDSHPGWAVVDGSVLGGTASMSPTYAGLPARTTIPSGVRRSNFHAEMLRSGPAIGVTVLLIDPRLWGVLMVTTALLSLLMIAMQAKHILRGVRELMARQHPPPHPAAAVTILLLCLMLPGKAFADAEVRMPLAAYLKMKKEVAQLESGTPSTSIDRIRLSGSFADGDLTLTLAGQADAHAGTVALRNANDLRLHDCAGDGLIIRDKSDYSLTPRGHRFTIHCRITPASSNELSFQTPTAATLVESETTDGDLVTKEVGDGRQAVELRRSVELQGELKPSTTIGHYTIQLMPEGAHFKYQLDVHNPNPVRVPYSIQMRSGEFAIRVSSKSTRGSDGESFVFELPPGDTGLLFSGMLRGNSFIPPVASSQQYVLLESHPALRAEVGGTPTRISIAESGLTPTFRGADVFLLGIGERLDWNAVNLKTMAGPTIAMPESAHTFFVTKEGEVLGESDLHVENQGASELVLPVQARPTFASIEGAPVPLTRGTGNHLELSLRDGRQWLEMQFRGALRQRFGLAWGRLWLPQVETPSSRSQIDVRYPTEWVPLLEFFRSELRVRELDSIRARRLLCVMVASTIAFLLLGFSRRRTAGLAAAIGMGALTSDWVSLGASAMALGIGSLWLLRRLPIATGLRISITALFVLAVVLASARLLSQPEAVGGEQNVVSSSHFGRSTPDFTKAPVHENCNGYDDNCDGYADNYAGSSTILQTASWSTNASPDPHYRGLPARLKLPVGTTTSTFTAEMLSTDEPTGVQVLLIDRRLLTLLGAMSLLPLIAALAWSRHLLRGAIHRLTPEAVAQPEGGPQAPPAGFRTEA